MQPRFEQLLFLHFLIHFLGLCLDGLRLLLFLLLQFLCLLLSVLLCLLLGGDGSGLVEKVVFINRSSKVVKGGRRFSFSALVVVGDKKGRVGLGLGKGKEVSESIRKGGEIAKARMVSVSLKDTTIPHEVISRYCGAHILLRPASPGTGVIAGKTVRAVLESVGVKDVLSKSLGSKNAANVVKATLAALQQLRLREEIYLSRGRSVKKAEVVSVTAP